jgi:hypothetical protein
MRPLSLLVVAALAITACGGGGDGGPTGSKPVATITVAAASASITVGQTTQLTPTTKDANGNTLTGRTVTYATGSSTVATVSASGVVTGVGPGVVVITATSEGKSGTVTITVAQGGPDCSTGTTTSLAVGEVKLLSGNERSTLCLPGGSSGAEFALIPVNTSASRLGATASFVTSGTAAATGPPAAAASLTASQLTGLADPSAISSLAAVQGHVPRNTAFERSLRAMTREMRATAASRRRMASIVGGLPTRPSNINGLPANPAVGTLVAMNTSITSSCTTPTNRTARVAAVSSSAIVLEDTLRPAGGFSDAEYLSIATTFDTLVYSVDTTAFGAPFDMDGNGRVILFFTSTVNALTPASSSSVIQGFFFERDLFPRTATQTVPVSCPSSNEGEMFYLPVVDPNAQYNPWFRQIPITDVIGTTVHEFQHLINASRRIYVTPEIVEDEEDWLNEAMSHTAQEILYFHVAGLTPRSDVTFAASRSTATRLAALDAYQADNLFDFSAGITAVETSTAFAPTDPSVELTTRGLGAALLRWALDQSPGDERTYLKGLVDAPTQGIPNFNLIFGGVGGLTGAVRATAVANFTDNSGIAVNALYSYPSWNYRDWLPHFTSNANKYPLATRSLLSGTPVNLTLKAGASSVMRFRVSAGATAAIGTTFGGAGGATAVDLMLVRTQ